MMRKRLARLKLAPFTRSHAKCDAVDALPPLPQMKMCRPSSRAFERIPMACSTFARSTVSIARNNSALYCSGKLMFSVWHREVPRDENLRRFAKVHPADLVLDCD